jgi:(R,R)-butanediol dehydrogenase/meso-butanediol dehydrogenase/diacetyl reductase/L-iditol 2-dehydrogenase
MESMKALVTTSLGDPEKHLLGEVNQVRIPIPEPGPEELRIKVAYASICGSDARFLKGGLGSVDAFIRSGLPRRMGHEISGTVDKVGEKAAGMGWKEGDRVTGNFMHFCHSCHYCRNGQEAFCEDGVMHMDAMSEYVTWHMSQVFRVPDAVDLLDAVLTEPLSVALHAVETAQLQFGSRVAVFGGGGIGLLCTALAKHRGASRITLFEPIAEKRGLALAFGADSVLDPTNPQAQEQAMEDTDHLGYDAVLECSGAAPAARMALSILGVDGHAVYFSMYQPDFELGVNLFELMYRRQYHLHGMFNSSDGFEKTLRMLPLIQVRPLIQKIYTLDEYNQAFRDQLSGKYAKIAFRIHPEG